MCATELTGLEVGIILDIVHCGFLGDVGGSLEFMYSDPLISGEGGNDINSTEPRGAESDLLSLKWSKRNWLSRSQVIEGQCSKC